MKDGKVNNAEQLCSVRRLSYLDGREKGENIIEVSNGVLSFTVLENHALDIFSLRHKGENISFISKNGLVPFSDEFGQRFCGGMLYTCGLDTVGGRVLPIHGKIHNIPATVEGVFSDGKSVEITGTVRCCELFGSNLVLKRRIYTEYGSGEITVENEIINEGYVDDEFCVLFHMNIGYPMLDEGTKVVAPVITTTGRTDFAKDRIEKCFIMENPADSEEQVFYNTVKKGSVKVINEKINKQMEFTYDEKVLPYFIEWKSMVKGDYALGIEPSTTTLDDGFKKETIKSGESKKFTIKLSVSEIK